MQKEKPILLTAAGLLVLFMNPRLLEDRPSARDDHSSEYCAGEHAGGVRTAQV